MQTEGNSKDRDQMAKELKARVLQATDPQEKLDAQCKLVLFWALKVGADVNRLTKQTGCPRHVVEAISRRMRLAGLWVGRLVDDQEWWDHEDNLIWGFSAHALVAQGRYIREGTDDVGCRYIDRETGNIVGEWSPSDYIRAEIEPLERVMKRVKSELRDITAKSDIQIKSLIERLDEELLEFEDSESVVFVDVRSGPKDLRMVFSEAEGMFRLTLGQIVRGRVSHPYSLLNAPRQEQIAALRVLPAFILKGIEILTRNYQLMQKEKRVILKAFSEVIR